MSWDTVDPRAATYPPGDPSAWWRVAFSDEVGRRPRGVQALSDALVLFRGAGGEVVALDRHCPHLGADLADGRVVDGCLECPFHRWQFDGDGQLRHVPAGGKIPPIRARRWEVREVGGMVFVWRGHGGRNASPGWDDPLGGSLDGLRPLGRKVVEGVATHVLEIVENSVDDQHFLPLHAAFRVPWTRWRVPGVTVLHQTRWERDPERDWVVRFTDDAVLSIFGRVIARTGARATVSFIGPGGVLHLLFEIPNLGRVLLIQTQTPTSPLRQQVAFRWFADRRVPALVASYVVGEWYAQWLLDVDIWERKIYLPRPQLVAADGPVHELRRWLRRFFDEQALVSP